MPLQDHKITKKIKDRGILRLPKFVKDVDDTTIYPQEVLKAFIKYFNGLYQERVAFADRFVVDGEDKSHLDLFVYVPGDLSREDFLDDLSDFLEEYPDVKGDLIKRWPNKEKPSDQGIQMAKNAKSAYPERKTFEGLKPEELEVAKKYFFEEYDREFDESKEEDKEDIIELYNENQRELREWYPAEVRLSFNVGKFAPNKEGNVDLLSLYDKKSSEDSIKAKDDEEDPKLKVCRLLGEAHDKIMEALDLVEELENEEKVPSSLRYDLEDLESSASEFDYMGESNPVDVLMGTYPLEVEWDLDEEDEDLDEEEDW